MPLVLDASPCQRTISLPHNRMLAIVLEEAELTSVIGTCDVHLGIAELHRRGCRNVVIAHGTERITYSDGTSSFTTPLPASKPIDRCGAIECLDVWIGLGLVRELPIADVCQMAASAMAFSLGQMGGQRGMPTQSNVAAIMSDSAAISAR